MRVAIISDIHGNLPALDAVLGDISDQPGIDRVYCLGDLVGYGPFPNEVATRIRDQAIPTLIGNYDDGVGFDRADCGCAYRTSEERRIGEQSFDWTREHTLPETKAFLRTLLPEIRFSLDDRRILLVHASPRRLNEYLFEDRPTASFRRLAAAGAGAIVFGHTHIPYIKLVDDVLFVNVGSVGKPKDGDPRACYAILSGDDEAISVRFRRVRYDLARATAAIRASDLPNELARDLELAGRQPMD